MFYKPKQPREGWGRAKSKYIRYAWVHGKIRLNPSPSRPRDTGGSRLQGAGKGNAAGTRESRSWSRRVDGIRRAERLLHRVCRAWRDPNENPLRTLSLQRRRGRRRDRPGSRLVICLNENSARTIRQFSHGLDRGHNWFGEAVRCQRLTGGWPNHVRALSSGS